MCVCVCVCPVLFNLKDDESTQREHLRSIFNTLSEYKRQGRETLIKAPTSQSYPPLDLLGVAHEKSEGNWLWMTLTVPLELLLESVYSCAPDAQRLYSSHLSAMGRGVV